MCAPFLPSILAWPRRRRRVGARGHGVPRRGRLSSAGIAGETIRCHQVIQASLIPLGSRRARATYSTRRHSHRAAQSIRVRDQPKDRRDTRAHDPLDAPLSGDRGAPLNGDA